MLLRVLKDGRDEEMLMKDKKNIGSEKKGEII